MSENIYVQYTPQNGIRFFDDSSQEFNGNLVCPSAGQTFVFNQSLGSSGWVFNALAVDHQDGPDTAQLSWTVQSSQIDLQDPGNGKQAESNYDYTLTIQTTTPPIETVSIDPRIKNEGGSG